MSGARVTPDWLALREPADAAARAARLVEDLRGELAADRPLVIHDLACGTGSMLRWLAPQLPGPQHWVCYDLDADLLAVAGSQPEQHAADGSPVTATTQQRDVTRLSFADCSDADLITTSALLDLLTDDELERIVALCVATQAPALLSLSVTGRVELWPPDALDVALGAAFNDHQRRTVGARPLLGPDAVDAVMRAFRASGYEVRSSASPWRLGGGAPELLIEWLTGWLAAACAQRPELTAQLSRYADQRLADAEAGRLRAVVHHRDVVARPSPKTG